MAARQRPAIAAFEVIENYRVIKQISNGGFGVIYFVRELGSNQPAAMKFERGFRSQLEIEVSVLKQLQPSLYFPRFYRSGQHDNFNYYVMELLGPSLSRLRTVLPNATLSISTGLRVAIETVCILREFHSRGFVHRDIKPANFLVRRESPSPICLIDFGLTKRYTNPETGQPHEPIASACFIGTARYASVNAHQKMDLAPRDDMISWLFSMVELMTGQLPWRSLSDKAMILRMKESTSPEELCADVPRAFVDIYKGLVSLEYEEMPDYDMILGALSSAMREAGAKTSDQLDWELLDETTIANISVGPMLRKVSDGGFDLKKGLTTSTPEISEVSVEQTRLLSESSSDEGERKKAKCPVRCCVVC